MPRLAVYDTVDTPQRFDLVKLMDVIVGHIGSRAEVWRVRRAEGYGLAINQLSDELDALSEVHMDAQVMEAFLPGLDEWLFWFDAVTGDGRVSFGVFDSSYMFVDGPPDVITAVRLSFDEVRSVQDPES